MADKIQIKRSSEEGKKPTPEQLAEGELALNLKDRKIYAKDSDGVVQEFPAVESVDVGVEKVNGLQGEVEILGSENINVTKSGQNLTLNVTDKVALKTDIPDIPTPVVPGDGNITLSNGTGINISGTDATANQTGDTGWSVSVDDTVALKSDIPPAVVPGDGAITLKSTDNSVTITGQNATANQTGDTSWDLSVNAASPITPGDGAINLTGGTGIDVTGDNASANQTGNTEWSVAIDSTVALKSDIPAPITPGDGNIALTAGTGINITGTDATANQTGDTSWSVAVDDTVALKSDIPDIPTPVAPGDGNITLISSDDTVTVSGDNATANQAGDTEWDLSVDFPVKDIQSANPSTLAITNENGVYTLTAVGGGGSAGGIIVAAGDCIKVDSEIVDISGEDFTKYTVNLNCTIPSNTSDLNNDSGFITAADIPDPPTVPENTSDLNNDGSDGINPFITSQDLPQSTSELENDGDGSAPYITEEALNGMTLCGSLEDVDCSDSPVDVNTAMLLKTDSDMWSPGGAGQVSMGSKPLEGWEAGSVGEAIENAGGSGGVSNLPISSVDDTVVLSDDGASKFILDAPAGADLKTDQSQIIMRQGITLYAPYGVPVVVESDTTQSLVGFKGTSDTYYAGVGTTSDFEITHEDEVAFRINSDGHAVINPGDSSVTVPRANTMLESVSDAASPFPLILDGTKSTQYDGRTGIRMYNGTTNIFEYFCEQSTSNYGFTGGSNARSGILNGEQYADIYVVPGSYVEVQPELHVDQIKTFNDAVGDVDLALSAKCFKVNFEGSGTQANAMAGTSWSPLMVASQQYVTGSEDPNDDETGWVENWGFTIEARNRNWNNGAGSFGVGFISVVPGNDEFSSPHMVYRTSGNQGGGHIFMTAAYSSNPKDEEYTLWLDVNKKICANKNYVPTLDNHLATRKFVTGGDDNATGGFLPLAGGTMDIGGDILMPSGNSDPAQLQVGGDEADGFRTGLNICARGKGSGSNKNVQIAGWATDGGSATLKLCTGDGGDIDHYWNFRHQMEGDDADVDALRITSTGSTDWAAFVDHPVDGESIRFTFDTTFIGNVHCNNYRSQSGTTYPVIAFESGGSVLIKSEETKAYYQQYASGFHIFQSDGSQSRFTENGDFLVGTATPFAGTDVIPESKTYILAKGDMSVARWTGQTDDASSTCNLFLDCDPVDNEVQFYANNQITIRKEDGSEYVPQDNESIATKKYVDDHAGSGGGGSVVVGTPTSATEPNDPAGSMKVDEDFLWVKTPTAWKKLSLSAFDEAATSVTVQLTQAAFDAISVPDPNVLYVIVG